MDILREYTSSFMQRFRWAQQVKNVLSRILLCRTAPLGGHQYELTWLSGKRASFIQRPWWCCIPETNNWIIIHTSTPWFPAAALRSMALDGWPANIRPISDPKQVLKYLARYLAGGPIADSRLISLQDDEVTLWARPKVNASNQPRRTRREPEPFTLKCLEFVRRWTIHILPKGFTRTRRYGGFSGAKCKDYIPQCVALLKIQPEELEQARSVPSATERQPLKCARCQCELVLLNHTPRPSWRIVFERIYSDPNLYNPMWHIGYISSRSSTGPPRPPAGSQATTRWLFKNSLSQHGQPAIPQLASRSWIQKLVSTALNSSHDHRTPWLSASPCLVITVHLTPPVLPRPTRAHGPSNSCQSAGISSRIVLTGQSL
jgi:hypothetical protein